jgi:three-Cys-motif partner protein
MDAFGLPETDPPGGSATGSLESRVQTQQKLEVMLRYWPVWSVIIAQADGLKWCNRCLWLIDGFAGTGFHRSTAHPDGKVAGTPMQAFRAAVNTKRRFPNAEFHLRAVEANPAFAQELQRRMIAAPGAADTKPDWRVYQTTFRNAFDRVLDDMRADLGHVHASGPTYTHHDHRSLWFIDPFGVKDIPHEDLERLERLAGAEVIINLDLGGLLRVRGAAARALDDADPDAFATAVGKGNARRMDLTWGSDHWRDDLRRADRANILRSVAQSYADTFRTFDHRNVYALRGSRTQKRYLVHLTYAATAADRFKGICDSCFRINTLIAGDRLGQPQRATRAVQLHERFKGTTTTVPELYELGMGASRRQIAEICRSAVDLGLGEFDRGGQSMVWFGERLPDPTLFDL